MQFFIPPPVGATHRASLYGVPCYYGPDRDGDTGGCQLVGTNVVADLLLTYWVPVVQLIGALVRAAFPTPVDDLVPPAFPIKFRGRINVSNFYRWKRIRGQFCGCMVIAVIFAAAVLALTSAGGCASKPTPVRESRPLAGAGESAARADAGVGFVNTMLDRAYNACSETGQAFLDAARAAADSALADLAAVRVQLADANKDRDGLIGQLETSKGETLTQQHRAEKAESQFGFVVWDWTTWLAAKVYVWSLIGVSVGVVIRLAAFFVGGTYAPIIANAGNGLIHLSTGLVSWIVKKIFGWRSAAKAAA